MSYVFWRIMSLVPVVLGITIIAFLLMYIIPGDPAELLAGPEANQTAVEALRRQLGLDRPLIVRYLDYMVGLSRLDLGTSIRTKRPVATEIMRRLPNTLVLAGIAIALATVFGVLSGILAAVRHGTSVDSSIMVVSLLGVSTPSFWLALMLMLLFALYLQWLPAAGSGNWRHLVLPSLTLAAVATGEIARMTRADMLDVLRDEYIKTARAKGLTERAVIFTHALKNALIPTVTVVGLRFGHLLTGSIIVETIFVWPGLGRLIIDAIRVRDYPVVQGAILVFGMSFVLVNLLVDLAYGWLDPRIRYQ